jgi:SAM-dependent methyltransferase
MMALNWVFYDLIYRISKPPWDDGTIPSQVAQLASHKGKMRNAIDLGCGTGTHVIYLAEQGFTVTGVDVSPTAISQAKEKASKAGVKPEFVVHDVTRLDFLRGQFDIALDLRCFHGLSKGQRTRYEENLARLTHPGSLFLLWARKDVSSFGIGIGPAEVGKIFSPHFLLENTEQASLHGRASAWYWFKRR